MHDEQIISALRHASTSGKWLRTKCPFCFERTGKEDKRGALGVDSSSGGYHCLAGETSVMTWDGYRVISELAGSTHRVLAVGVDGISRWVESPFYSYGEQQLFNVHLRRNGVKKTIRATSDHRWFVRSNAGQYTERLTKDLKPNHRMRAARLPSSNGQIKPSPWGVAHGFVFGDGTLPARNRGAVVHLWGDKDSALSAYYPKSNRSPAQTEQGVDGIRIGNLPRYFKEYPPIDESSSYLYGWLAGYFAADGCVAEDGNCTLASAVRDNLEFVRLVCIRLGITTHAIKEQVRKGLGKADSSLFSLAILRSSLNEEFFIVDKHRARWIEKREVQERLGWVVDHVEPTGVTDEVFCAEVAEHGCFVLEDNLLTGNCFRCGVHGKAKLPADLETDVPEELDTERVVIEKPESFFLLADERDSWSLKPAWDYLLGRGITERTICESGIGACVSGFFEERIVVPINPNADGDWLGFVARDWTNTSELRYRYPKGMKRNLLFNHDALFVDTDEPAIVVEGVFDALPYWPHAVACLGKPIKEHVAALMVARRPLAIALDGDAHREGDALAMLLRFEGRRAGFVKLPPGADPNSVDQNWLRNAARESINA